MHTAAPGRAGPRAPHENKGKAHHALGGITEDVNVSNYECNRGSPDPDADPSRRSYERVFAIALFSLPKGEGGSVLTPPQTAAADE